MQSRKFIGTAVAGVLMTGSISQAMAADGDRHGRRHHHHHHRYDRDHISGGDVIGAAVLIGIFAALGSGKAKRDRKQAIDACDDYFHSGGDGRILDVERAEKDNGLYEVTGTAASPLDDGRAKPFYCLVHKERVVQFEIDDGDGF